MKDWKFDCLWKNKNIPEICLNINHKNEKCHCDLEPCLLYKKRNLFRLLFRKYKKEYNLKFLQHKSYKILKIDKK